MPPVRSKLLKPSTSLELPHGYQRFDYYKKGVNPGGVVLDEPEYLIKYLSEADRRDLYLYTHHEIFLGNGIIKHTRSSPNWEGGIVTYATCKHLMRTYSRKDWHGVFIVGLCPRGLDNCVLFAGIVRKQFESNYDLSRCIRSGDLGIPDHPLHKETYQIKAADNNPRGDLYTPRMNLFKKSHKYDHNNFQEPPNHTRSVEYYKKSPGSVSQRKDGKIPKWWRDMEYKHHSTGRRPYSFILDPCWLFSVPQLWTSYNPKRATLKINPTELAESLTMEGPL